MTEVEKMRNGLLADMSSPELQVRFEHAKKLLARMRGMSTYDEMYCQKSDKIIFTDLKGNNSVNEFFSIFEELGLEEYGKKCFKRSFSCRMA